jgi:hypothetical protein
MIEFSQLRLRFHIKRIIWPLYLQESARTVMTTIAAKTKEITAAQMEQQSISELITIVVDKALIFYTQLIDVQVAYQSLDREIGNNRPDIPSGHNNRHRCSCSTHPRT